MPLIVENMVEKVFITRILDIHFGLFLSEAGKDLTTQLKELGLLEHSEKFIRKYILSYGGADFTTLNLLNYIQQLTTIEYQNKIIVELTEILNKKQDSRNFRILENLWGQVRSYLSWHTSKFHSFTCRLLKQHLAR